MKSGDLIHDFALGQYGMVVGGPWIEPRGSDSEAAHDSHKDITWEWLVLYSDGLHGADTNDLKVIDDNLRNL